ncbi:TetR family transcriptional regulator [Thiomonas intermedia]|uniref:TetR family transcriptional regulator n=1 Tax=Thiomonas intermedia TaxID=926 RepID=UPI001FE38A46|nr:TetR family transcriptional regulator [Thiomonas intermedia]
MELFVERGYEQTTVADIAERAGLTARTFFRYFPDKREVLFQGVERLEQTMVDALLQTPDEASAMTAVGTAMGAADGYFGDIQAFARRRRDVIAMNAELRERELIKLARLSAALAEALAQRGVDAVEARLAAETGMAVFRLAFELWLADDEHRRFGAIAADLLRRLARLAPAT